MTTTDPAAVQQQKLPKRAKCYA